MAESTWIAISIVISVPVLLFLTWVNVMIWRMTHRLWYVTFELLKVTRQMSDKL